MIIKNYFFNIYSQYFWFYFNASLQFQKHHLTFVVVTDILILSLKENDWSLMLTFSLKEFVLLY